SEPRANRLQMLAAFLNVSIVWLLTGRGEGAPVLPEYGDEETAAGPGGGEMAQVLGEMRKLRLRQARLAEELGRLEKRLAGLVGS
ncbi:MAG: transcriptional regulator, partial [Pseudomonadota bacterium]